MEDGAALGVLFSNFGQHEQVHERLRLFQRLRHDRVCAMQLLSRVGQDENAETQPDLRKYIKGPLPGVSLSFS